VKTYEIAKSKRTSYASVRDSIMYSTTADREIETKETETDMHEPSFGLRISSGGPRLTSFVEDVGEIKGVPMRDNPFSAFKILRYFRRNWKAQLISSDAKVNAINYKNIQNLQAVAKMVCLFLYLYINISNECCLGVSVPA
jgi:hypothetical protein